LDQLLDAIQRERPPLWRYLTKGSDPHDNRMDERIAA
jgi:hypothetical protein